MLLDGGFRVLKYATSGKHMTGTRTCILTHMSIKLQQRLQLQKSRRYRIFPSMILYW